MTPESRIELFARAIWAASAVRETRPDNPALRSIERQLFYLIGVSRETLPTDRLHEVTLDALIGRTSGWDAPLTELLTQCAREAHLMQREIHIAKRPHQSS